MKKIMRGCISIFRQILITCLVLGIIGVVIVGWGLSSTQYIYRKTEFFSYFLPKEIYYFDAIGHGKDYDALRIFQLSEYDGKRFLSFSNNREDWNSLPVGRAATNQVLCDIEFDANMRDMLAKEDGYWTISPENKLFCVYDASSRLLYIRTASCLTRYKWEKNQ